MLKQKQKQKKQLWLRWPSSFACLPPGRWTLGSMTAASTAASPCPQSPLLWPLLHAVPWNWGGRCTRVIHTSTINKHQQLGTLKYIIRKEKKKTKEKKKFIIMLRIASDLCRMNAFPQEKPFKWWWWRWWFQIFLWASSLPGTRSLKVGQSLTCRGVRTPFIVNIFEEYGRTDRQQSSGYYI